MIWVGCEADYYLSEDWTGQISLKRFRKFGCTRRRRGRPGGPQMPSDRAKSVFRDAGSTRQLSAQVTGIPNLVTRAGPYRYIRHPFYASCRCPGWDRFRSIVSKAQTYANRQSNWSALRSPNMIKHKVIIQAASRHANSIFPNILICGILLVRYWQDRMYQRKRNSSRIDLGLRQLKVLDGPKQPIALPRSAPDFGSSGHTKRRLLH